MKLRNLIEEFKTSFKNEGNYIEVFINPSKKEMSHVSQKISDGTYLRFMADPETKTVYVFKPDVLHAAIERKLKIPSLSPYRSLWGVAKNSNAGWRAISEDQASFSGLIRKAIASKNWDWVNKYINVDNLTKELKQRGYRSSEKYYPREFRAQKKISEAFFTSTKSNDEYYEIFKDPTQKEMNDVTEKINNKKYLRFIADPNKKTLFVFSPSMFHVDASIKIGHGHNKKPGFLWGVAEKMPSGWEFVSSDETVNSKSLKTFSWLNKYKILFNKKLSKKIEGFQDTSAPELNPRKFKAK